MIAVPQNYVSADEYLRWEEQQEEKHEYIDGQVYAMAGASENHVDITTNLTVILSNHLRGKDCKLFPSDMRLNSASKKIYYYPDLLVTCDERDRFNKKQKNYPCLIIEVLSESTESKDRGVKFANYQTIQSLQEYVLISQWEQRVEVFRRSEKFWVLQTYTVGELIEFQSINLQIPIDAIYEDVDLLAASSEAILESTI
ncbi:MAG: Uma2 family endonuclease [Pseudanabaena sp.]